MTAASERELDLQWMRRAISAAGEARERDEGPIGTWIVVGETLLGVAGSRTRTVGGATAHAGNRTRNHDHPTAHAQIVALREAAAKVGNYRLLEAVVYSTIEPCVMC